MWVTRRKNCVLLLREASVHFLSSMCGELLSAHDIIGDAMMNIWHKRIKNVLKSQHTPKLNLSTGGAIATLFIYCKSNTWSCDRKTECFSCRGFFAWCGDPLLSCRPVYHDSSLHLHRQAPCQRSSGRLRALLRPGLDFVRLLLHPRHHLPRPAEEKRVTGQKGGKFWIVFPVWIWDSE